MAKVLVRGTPEEVKTFTEVYDHYTIAKEDLQQRIMRKNGFDDADKMFSSHIDEGSWPYRSLTFDPRPFTVILEKSARLIGSKPKGRLVPREGGDTLGANINNELLSFQWDDNSRLGESMISKWIMMDMNTRRYGAAFGLCKWRYECKTVKDEKGKKKEVFYDGPDFVVCNPRDVLANPAYTYVKNWFQHREYVTVDELQRVNDAARREPIYKNLDVLRESVKESLKGRGDTREAQYQVQNKTIRGLSDYLGRDETFKVVELVTEYRNNRWITFAPRHGCIVRDVESPYRHSEIPVVQLKYYPLPDDLYGMSEYEPVSKLFKAINAHLSAYNDYMAIALRPPLMVNPVNVRMHTLSFDPEAKWLMNNPGQDVIQMKMDTNVTSNFQSVYTVLVGSALNALGENSQGYSQANPTQDSGNVTATEIKDTAFTRNVRDNMNKIFLSEAVKKQTMFWHSMNQQFMFQDGVGNAKVIRVVGRDAVEFFKRQGLADIRPTEQDVLDVTEGRMSQEEIAPGPRYAVNLDGEEVPKFQPDEMGEGGNLILEPGDLTGSYDYIPDIESMKSPSSEDVSRQMQLVLGTITNPTIISMLQAEGKKPKVSEMLIKLYEATGVIKDAEAYFETINNMDVQSQINATGGGGTAPGAPTAGVGQPGGLEVGSSPLAAGTNPPQLAGPSPM